jgi:hypothetical protein
MECEFCKKIYSSTSSLLYHQRTTKKCVQLQEEKGVSYKQFYECTFCKKQLTTKCNLDSHLSICKCKIKEDVLKETRQNTGDKFERKLKELEDKLKDMEHKLKETSDELTHIKQKLSKPKKIAIPKSIKTMVWNRYIGSNITEEKCICCQQEKINIRHFHCGHILAESNGGTLLIENLRPICGTCNTSMGNRNMREFIKTFFNREI